MSSTPTVIDLHDGAYGPTLRVDVQDRSALEWLCSVFLTLAQQQRTEVVLEANPEVEFSGLHRIRLRVDYQRRGRRKDLERAEVGGVVELVWTLDAYGWETKAEMVERLVRSGHAGHQYLTAEGVDDALVELAYLEGPRAG